MRRRVLALLLITSCSRTCSRANEIRSEPAHESDATPIVDATDDVLDAHPSCADASVDAEAEVRVRYAAWRKKSGDGPSDFDAAVENGFVHRDEIADLDGDGVKEIAWTFILRPVADVQHVYRGGSCSAYLGELAPGTLTLEKTKHDGFPDVYVEDWGTNCEGAPCGCTPAVSHYEMSHGVYKENKARHDPGHVNLCTDD